LETGKTASGPVLLSAEKTKDQFLHGVAAVWADEIALVGERARLEIDGQPLLAKSALLIG